MSDYKKLQIAKRIIHLEKALSEKNSEISRLNSEIHIERERANSLEHTLNVITGSRSYKYFAKYLQKPINISFRLTRKVFRLAKALLTLNFKAAINQIKDPLNWQKHVRNTKKEINNQMETLTTQVAEKTVIVFPSTIDWHMPMYQRPQQLAVSFAEKENTFVIYLTNNSKYDQVGFAEQIKDNLWIINNSYCDHLNNLLASADKIILFTAWAINEPYRKAIKHDLLVYDFIDDLEIFGEVDKNLLNSHNILLNTADLTVCTANKLYEKAAPKARNAIISPNAGDYNFFSETNTYEINPLIREKVSEHTVCIGYYGALAAWVDYKLIKDAAALHPEWLFVLVGMDIDGTLATSGILEFDNIVYIPPQPYAILPSFLKAFDVATIPFVINEITLGTSPVKLFEYMSADKPIITSKMPECLKYESVRTYEGVSEFCSIIEEFIQMPPDDQYWSVLKQDALNNTWSSRTDEILQILDRLSEENKVLLTNVFEQYQGNNVFILPELVDWNIPLFQRPQQIALALAQQNILFVFTTLNQIDNINSPVLIKNNCLLITKDYIPQIMELSKQHNKHVIFDITSTNNHHYSDWFEQWAEYDYSILYEYIDEISAEISGFIPPKTLQRHEDFIKDENIYIVATADKLYNEVTNLRGSTVNTLNSSNGVDVTHFKCKNDLTKLPSTLQDIVTAGFPIIGYFGAIANWFDFELLFEAAKQRPEYVFLMIGPNYGNLQTDLLRDIEKLPNVIMPGTIDYDILPHIANHFTVATIPFVLNDITESTSPIKLFEYMAMGKPIVTTAMRECFKYPEVMIANTPEEYILCLDRAVELTQSSNFADYKNRLIEVANRNSWLNKAKEITELIDRNLR